MLEAVGAPIAGAIFTNGWLTIFLVIFGMFVIWIGATTSAPIRQRDEARLAVASATGSEVEVNKAIDTLRASSIREGDKEVLLIDVFRQLAPSIIASESLSSIEIEILTIMGLEKQWWNGDYVKMNTLTKRAGDIFSTLSAIGVVQTQIRRSIQSFTDWSKMNPSSIGPSTLRSEPADEVVVVMTTLGYQVHQKLTTG